MEGPKIKKTKSKKWYDEEMNILIKSWKANFHKRSNLKKKRLTPLYQAIREELQINGYERGIREIASKTNWLRNSYREEKQYLLKNGFMRESPYFFDLLEIEKKESEYNLISVESESSDEGGEEMVIEKNESECAQVNEDDFQIDALVSNSASQSCSADNNIEGKKSGESVVEDGSSSVNNDNLSSNDLPATTEDILQEFYAAFHKVNNQLKRNDETLLLLLHEQNEIFKTQNSLLVKLISKD